MENSTPLLLIIIFLLTALISSSSSTTPKLNIWPLPSSISWPQPIASPLSPSFLIVSPYTNHPHLRRAIARYSSLLRSERHRPLLPLAVDISSPSLLSLNISVAHPSAPLDISTNESYTITIPASSPHAILSAATAWGAIRGLETFSQMAWVAEADASAAVVVPAGIYVDDRPLFPHRGILLDTSRNYFPVKDIIRTIRAMGHSKLNVFHWHITDSQSFPLELPSEPNLSLRGSYGAAFRYSVDDVRRIVQYSMSYGIRVIPEIDAPGHTASWAEAYPEVVTCANKFWNPKNGPQLAAEPGTGQLNPLNSKTYEVIRNVLRDVATLFPDKFLHGGADEVNKACWEDDETIRKFLEAGGTHDELLEKFISITHPFITSSLNRTVVYWEDVLLGPNVAVSNPSTALPQASTVLQTWNNGVENTKRLVSAGYRVIVSSWKYYYLDCGFGTWLGDDVKGESWCDPYKSWQQVYDYDISEGLSEEERELVLGGEVALWSELADETVLDSRLWPRAAAAAEALWSGNRDEEGKRRDVRLTERMHEWRYRMVRRGIGAAPIQPLWCVRHDGMCNLDQ